MSTHNIRKFLEELKSQDIFIDFKDEKLKIKAPKNIVTPEILNQLKESKDAIKLYFEYGVGKEYKLSFSQERLWFLNQLEGNSATYNMPGLLLLEGQVNKPVLNKALLTIVQRHEILRSNFINRKPK